jgi:hypothetical protein
MALIKVPRPQNAWNPDRPVSSLLKAQIEYLHDAEKRLPLRYRSEIYVNAIKTEGEASRYIREVTQAIHNAHEDAQAQRVRKPAKRKGVILIAAVADEGAERKRAAGKRKVAAKGNKSQGNKKKKSAGSARKKS